MAKRTQQATPYFGKVYEMTTVQGLDELPQEFIQMIENQMVRVNGAGIEEQHAIGDMHTASWLLWNNVMSRHFGNDWQLSARNKDVEYAISSAMSLVGDVTLTTDGNGITHYPSDDAVGNYDEIYHTLYFAKQAKATLLTKQHALSDAKKLMEYISKGIEAEERLLNDRLKIQESIISMATEQAQKHGRNTDVMVNSMFEVKEDLEAEVINRRRPLEWYSSTIATMKEYIANAINQGIVSKATRRTHVEQKVTERLKAMADWAQYQLDVTQQKEEAKRQRAEERKRQRSAQ